MAAYIGKAPSGAENFAFSLWCDRLIKFIFIQQHSIGIDMVIVTIADDGFVWDFVSSLHTCECGGLNAKYNSKIFIFIAADDLFKPADNLFESLHR